MTFPYVVNDEDNKKDETTTENTLMVKTVSDLKADLLEKSPIIDQALARLKLCI